MRTTIAAAIVAASLAAACSQDARDQPKPLPPDEAVELLQERIWLDKQPRTGGDRFHLMIFDHGDFGVYQDRTIWKGNFEMFMYKAKDRTIEMRLPGSRKTVKTGFRVERVRHGEADVKLTLDNTFAGPKSYYGYQFDGDADAYVESRFGTLPDSE